MSKRKRRLRKQMDTSLLETLSRVREDWLRKKKIVEKSIDPHEEVLYEVKLAEARYLFLLKETKVLFSENPS